MKAALFGSAFVIWAICALHVSDALACGVVTSGGAYVRLAEERAIIVWDEGAHVEHFIRKPLFEGDPRDFGFFVPTPVTPAIAKERDDAFDVLDRLVPYAPPPGAKGAGRGAAAAPGSVEALQRVRVDDFEIVTLRANDAHALVEWLDKREFATRPSLELWASRYVSRGWVLSAMRYAPTHDSPDKTIATPTVRFSFKIDRPFYPYTEAPPSPGDEAAFMSRARRRLGVRPLDVWLVAATEVSLLGLAREGHAAVGTAEAPGPTRVGTAKISAADLAAALGDTHAWGFDPRAHDDWVVTRFHEQTSQRTAFDDLVFAPPGASLDAPGAPKRTPRAKIAVFAILLAAIALGVALALRGDATY